VASTVGARHQRGDRSLRRWAAGTDEIPNGVWRDIGFRLESLQDELEYLIGEVKRMTGLVEDHRAGEMVQPSAKSTAARIARIGGNIIPGTAEWMTASSVDPDDALNADLPDGKINSLPL
jgi:hypothetical protein